MEVEAVRRDQFAEFAKAVQVGLLDYQGPQGIKSFFSLMKSRYGQVGHALSSALSLDSTIAEVGSSPSYPLPRD